MKNHNPTATTFACNSTANPHTVKIHDSAPRSTRGRRNAGFSLVEIMITVLIIAVLGGVALTSFGTTRESTSQIAMQGDASMMNKAIQAYTAGGGSLDGVTNPNDVLAKLKTKPLATQAATIAGARGPFVDLRLELRPATSANAFSLVYLPERTSFVMVNGSSGLVTGVNEELAKQPVATEERHVSLALATEDKWVWDYADAATLDRPAADRPLDKRSSTLGTSTPSAYSIVPLAPPQFSLPGSQLGPLDSPKTLTITHSNPAGAGELFVRVNGGEWSRYANAITLPIGEAAKIESYTDTLSPDDFSASNMASVAFTFKPGQLTAPTIAPASGQFKWAEFPTTLTLNNPNFAGTSNLEYKIGTGAWTAYTTPVVLTPDTTVAVSSRAVPIDSRLWFTSDTASATYELQSENLLAPVYSKAAGSYPALQYPLTVALTNPNPTGSSTLEYRQLNGTWQAYISPITLAATQVDVTLEARAVTTDAKRWVTSPTASSRYVLTRSTLYAPVITPAGGYYPFSGFPTAATLTNPNPAGSSDIYYRFGTSGTFIKYDPLTPPALSNLNYTTTLQAYAKSLLTVQFDDSPQAQAIYDSIYFTASTGGLFHDPSSATPTKMVTNMAPPKTGSLFKWGGTSSSGQTQSWLQFDGSPSGTVAPGDWFQIGKLTYYNGTITTGTGADKVNLKFALNITLPTATITNADFTLNLVNTPNTSDANASADYVYIPALSVPFTTSVGGKNFKLDVRFGETTANGFGSLTEFHVLEEKSATGTMYGRMTEIVP